MPGSTAGCSSVVPSITDYDDAAPLTLEEEEALSKMEADSHSSNLKMSDSPPQKKRKCGLSASPHLTPSRLRSSVKATARALDAGYIPNTNHAFRQDLSSNMPPPNAAIPNRAAMAADANARRSESIGPSEQNPQLGGHDNRSAMADDDARRSLSIGPTTHNHPAAQTGEHGNPGGMAEHPGGHYHQNPQIPHPQRADNDARRSLSIDPTDHPGVHYHPYPQIPHPQQVHRYAAYPGPGQPHPYSMPPPYFQPPGLSFGNQQNPAIYPNPPFQDQNHSRIQAGMPTEGPNPAADVFSPQYIPVDRQQSLQAPALQPAAHSTASSSTRHLTPAPARSLTPLDGASHLPLGPSSVTEAAAPAAEPTKVIPVQAATPLPAIPEDSDVNCKADCKEGGEHNDDILGRSSRLEDSPTVGRMSNIARHALREGFKDLDVVLKRISVETGLHPAQIVDRWDATKTRIVSSWNIYQGFFEERRDEELARLPIEARPPVGGLPNKPTISACYEHFKASQPDTYDDVLRAWHRLHQMVDKGKISVSKRIHEFKKYTDKIDALVRQVASIHGFETLCLTVGGVVNQDQNLARLIGSDATIDYFLERYRSADSLALGHLKAHVYDRLSKRALLDDDPPEDGTYAASMVVKKEPMKEPMPVGEAAVPTVHDLKEKFIELASRHRITVTKGANLLWRALPQNIAEKGCVLVNWPEDVPFPCDEAGKNTSKGISVLKQPARTLLFAAFDHPTLPLSIEKKYNSAVPVDKPAIIGVPPDSSSPHAFGRRKFLDNNLNEDRKGPARLKPMGAPKPQKATGHTSKKKEASKSSRKVEAEDDSDVPMRLLGDASDGEDADEDAKPRAPKKKPASKLKSKVHFVMPDDTDDPLYSSSQDASAQYSGSDDDMPLVRSPHNLRRKASSKHKKSQTKRGTLKQCSPKRPLSSAEEEVVASEASIIELDADPTPRPSKSEKKNRSQPNTELTDKVAEALFGNIHRTEEMGKSTVSASAAQTGPKPPPLTAALHSNQPPHTEVAQPSIPHANPTPALPTPASNANQPAQIESGQPPVPQQQAMDHLPNSYPPALRQGREAFYPTNYPAFSEAYGGRYTPLDHSGRYAPPDHGGRYAPPDYGGRYASPDQHPPANWNLAPGQGWYPPGPGNPPPPAASNPPISGPMHHGSYWAHQGPPMYTHPYGHYPAPNLQEAHPPPDDISRTHGDGQAGSST